MKLGGSPKDSGDEGSKKFVAGGRVTQNFVLLDEDLEDKTPK